MNTPSYYQELVAMGTPPSVIACVAVILLLIIFTLLHVDDTRTTLILDTDREKWRLAYTKKQKQRRQAQQAYAHANFGSTRSTRREYHEKMMYSS
jgi:hypothetical protein